jgi:carbonic anhydrase
MMDTQTKNTQADMTPAKALQILMEGNERFVRNQSLKRDYQKQISETTGGQFPFAFILNCIDSRVPAEIIFDQGIGDIFNARIAGNIINDDILGSMEFACKLAGTRLIVVLGHTSCGAVMGACDTVSLSHLTGLLKKIEPAIKAIKTPDGVDRSSNNLDFVNQVAQKNMYLVMEEIRDKSIVLNELIQNKIIDIVGAMYDIETGNVKFYNV